MMPWKLILTHHLVVQTVDARRAEEEKFVITNLPFDEHGFVELLAANRTFLHIEFFGWLALFDDGSETDQGDEQNECNED